MLDAFAIQRENLEKHNLLKYISLVRPKPYGGCQRPSATNHISPDTCKQIGQALQPSPVLLKVGTFRFRFGIV